MAMSTSWFCKMSAAERVRKSKTMRDFVIIATYSESNIPCDLWERLNGAMSEDDL